MSQIAFPKLLLCLLCSLIILAPGAFAEVKKAKTVVSGTVRVASQDAKGNILSIEIVVGENENEAEPYLVADTGEGLELRKHVGDYVMAFGMVSEDKLGWKTIEVLKFQLEEDLMQKHHNAPTP